MQDLQHSSPTLRITVDMTNVRGATLIELLVAIVILMIIVASVYTAFNSGRDSWQVGETMTQKYQNARGALDMMSREISQAFINEAETIYCVGIDGEASSGDWVKTNAKAGSDQFFFAAPIAAATAATDLYRVGYWLMEDPADPNRPGTLERLYQGPNPELFDSNDNDQDGITDEFDEGYQFCSSTSSDPLASNVDDIDFTFYYGTGWTNDGDWDSRSGDDGLPKAVRITMVVEDDKGLTERTFTTVVYLNNAE